jgi:hypothetical protein
LYLPASNPLLIPSSPDFPSSVWGLGLQAFVNRHWGCHGVLAIRVPFSRTCSLWDHLLVLGNWVFESPEDGRDVCSVSSLTAGRQNAKATCGRAGDSSGHGSSWKVFSTGSEQIWILDTGLKPKSQAINSGHFRSMCKAVFSYKHMQTSIYLSDHNEVVLVSGLKSHRAH